MTNIQRNITVKGIGNVPRKPRPDCPYNVPEIQERDYADTMNRSEAMNSPDYYSEIWISIRKV
ncbi:MAG: hypothetical protein LBM93_01955 [Oscillospiraceae bacterium]|nr:hypothetical protein [Oscillospiraceae bacterium]